MSKGKIQCGFCGITPNDSHHKTGCLVKARFDSGEPCTYTLRELEPKQPDVSPVVERLVCAVQRLSPQHVSREVLNLLLEYGRMTGRVK